MVSVPGRRWAARATRSTRKSLRQNVVERHVWNLEELVLPEPSSGLPTGVVPTNGLPRSRRTAVASWNIP